MSGIRVQLKGLLQNMRYNQKYVKLPAGFKIGTEVYVVGEGDEIFTVDDIKYDKSGNVDRVILSCGWNEPLAKIWMKKSGQSFEQSAKDQSNWIDVRTGECDQCRSHFSDSYISHITENKQQICSKCWQKNKL